ncbi:hypothetical protein [uncultured Roseobacter sp.]|uniref:hypothetical protein n=1 Tax=uncultured Roseobacter sp. TaxID=114847 RepID=UPI00262A91FB|nr:hypothetical protein [uncultured Roseobacter sp.]
MKYLIATLFLAFATTPVLAQFKTLDVVGEIELKATIDERDPTMSGSLEHRVSMKTLFAAFQLFDGKNQDTIQMKDLDVVQIAVPESTDKDAKICTEIKTINGFYSAFGFGDELIDNGSDKTKDVKITAEHSDRIDGDYSEDMLLLRSYVAYDCLKRRSSYFVPMKVSEDPDTFLAVFEIGNASVEAKLFGVSGQGPVAPSDHLLNFECTTTKRVKSGYDCTFPLGHKNMRPFKMYEVRLIVTRPTSKEPKTFRARFALPPEYQGPRS